MGFAHSHVDLVSNPLLVAQIQAQLFDKGKAFIKKLCKDLMGLRPMRWALLRQRLQASAQKCRAQLQRHGHSKEGRALF